MNSVEAITVTTVPAIRYVKPDQAIAWLERALGFTTKVVYRNAAGVVEHAELILGHGMVMIGTFGHVKSSAHWFVQPNSIGAVTASVYVIVPSCEAVYRSAKTAGAEFLQEMEDKTYGGKSFIVRDPEGQIWSLGEYNPWSQEAAS